jgi:hypothetical protein
LSARVCLVQRARRGAQLRALRLVGQTTDASWPTAPRTDRLRGIDDNALAQFGEAAAWIRSSLQGPRTADSLEVLCLDADGAICDWLGTRSIDPALIASEARTPDTGEMPPEGEAPRAFASAVEYYAPSDVESSVQALGLAVPPKSRFGRESKKQQAQRPWQRVAVVAGIDTPARLLMDELDQAGVRVGEVCTFWHAMAGAWTSRARAPSEDRDAGVVASEGPLTCVVLVEPTGRLVWCWAREGELVTGGVMRLRTHRSPDAPDAPESPALSVVWSRDDVGVLTTEWMSWALELARTPVRVTCVLPTSNADERAAASPDALAPSQWCEALGAAWPGASVDAVLVDDPVGVTLRRLVGVVESTPAQAPGPERALVGVTNRPGREHRKMYLWTAGALALAGVALSALGIALRSGAEAQRKAAERWGASWRDAVAPIFPAALQPRAGLRPVDELGDEIQRRQDATARPERAEAARPVLQELEAISLVLGAPSIKVEQVTIDSQGLNRVVAVTKSTREAEALLEAFRRVGGSTLVDWSADIQPLGVAEDRRATLSAKWPAKGAPR